MATHVAILKWPYARLILDGEKTVESRLSKTARPPYRVVHPKDQIYFKASSGPFMAKAIAHKVTFYAKLTPEKVDALKIRYNREACGDDAYWESKQDARYATMISLRDVQPCTQGPKLPVSRGLAWYVIDQEKQPTQFQVILTPGSIRNRYVRVPPKVHRFAPSVYGGKKVADAGKPITLHMPDGYTVQTDIVEGTMFRWRGWGGYFIEYDMSPGDAVQFVQTARQRYNVNFVEQYRGPRSQNHSNSHNDANHS